ncbi:MULTISPECIES: type II toxin-antitoxin system RelE family toxin [Aerococcus]|uniref:type II toxin-antitoxin system RelE family toxin n=1 Tax=Aerococcus TaxID=1375 RepID=UPI000200ED6E|nr:MULTISPECIES: type II toxin-antitoxin system RelE/ParE family toxin [Aerococcus]AEA00504.1 plasmid stabilization system protein, RelE/ParE family [Aerococcus sp. Group 1]MCY3030730.1 hypothetical protein [Aerococcus sp. Group 1]MCY3055121.1 hypothetical protein [Aerococcus sp. Group 1]MCY3056851.1 hypothetical protein [Aerococcus sp. Group 1]MCY3062289.1 hypothetical protein [Aerococcus sp. Group 1]
MKEFIFKKKALKFLQKQSKNDQDRLITAIYQIPSGDIKNMAGYTHLKRLRVGKFRVLFNDDDKKVYILNIGSRGDIYINNLFYESSFDEGHPLGATGAIINCKAMSYLQDAGGKYGLFTMCVGGGMGAVGTIEMTD